VLQYLLQCDTVGLKCICHLSQWICLWCVQVCCRCFRICVLFLTAYVLHCFSVCCSVLKCVAGSMRCMCCLHSGLDTVCCSVLFQRVAGGLKCSCRLSQSICCSVHCRWFTMCLSSIIQDVLQCFAACCSVLQYVEDSFACVSSPTVDVSVTRMNKSYFSYK